MALSRSHRSITGALARTVLTVTHAESSLLASRRAFSGTARRCAPAAEAAAPSSSSQDSAARVALKQNPSSCAEGTPLTGLSTLKDQAEPAAKADETYPEWLWTLLDSSNKREDGLVLLSTVGLSKGEARTAEKKNVRMIRAANRAKERREAMASAAAAAAASKESVGDVGPPSGRAEVMAGAAEEAVRDPYEEWEEKRRALRLASREKIRSKNLIKGS